MTWIEPAPLRAPARVRLEAVVRSAAPPIDQVWDIVPDPASRTKVSPEPMMIEVVPEMSPLLATSSVPPLTVREPVRVPELFPVRSRVPGPLLAKLLAVIAPLRVRVSPVST